MSVERAFAERLARLVHYYCESLAMDFGGRSSECPDWEDVSQAERRWMVAAVELALLDLRSEQAQSAAGFAPPNAGGCGGSEGKECGC